MGKSDETQRDEANAKYFHDGWEGALREVIATDKHRGPEAAVQWAKDHSTHLESRDAEKSEGNPYGKTPEEIDRSNRWFRLAAALGKQDEFVGLLATERRRGKDD